jgi:hypothetical protein
MSDELQPAASVAIARQLAASHPGASLPCPVCAVPLKAQNLERHLGKTHAEHAQAGPSSSRLRARGTDRRIFVPTIALLILWAAGAMVVIVLAGGKLGEVESAILGGTGLLAFGLAAAAFTGAFKATLELEGETLHLRWLLGLASKQVRLPAKLETGTLTRQQLSNVTQDNVNVDSEEVKVGTYLRLRGGDTITIGAEGVAGLGKYWAQKGWSKAKKTRRTDIDIDGAALVALEYQLAARGQLTPKGA